MAKYDVQCRQCGAEITVQLFGPHRTREWKIDHYDWQCDACKEAAKQAAIEAAAKAAAEAGLPELEGSEKQIALAESIRQKFVDEADKYRKMYDAMDPEEAKEHRGKFESAVADILGRNSARFWIDNRTTDARTLIVDAAEALTSHPKHAAESAIAEDAKAEVTIRPAKVLKEITFPCLKARLVPAEKVVANDYDPNRVAPPEMRLLQTSIEEDGVTMPIVTYYDPENDRYIVVDGFHRYTVLTQYLNCKEIPIVTIDKEIGDRMASTIRHNRARGTHNIELMSNIVAELVEMGKSDQWIARKVGMDVDEILRLKQITVLAALFKSRQFLRAWE